MDLTATRKIFIQYCALQGAFWAAYCGLSSFAAVFLGEKGFSSVQIGLVLAVGGILGGLLQPVTGTIADNLKKITIQQMSALFLVGISTIALGMAFLKGGAVMAVLFVASFALMQIATPLVNSVSVSYINSGVQINFGAARACGSAVYALISVVLGRASVAWGGVSCVVSSVILFYLSAFIVLRMRPAEGSKKAAKSKKVTEQQSFLKFAMKYRRFMVVVLGLTLVMVFHFMINNYMIYVLEPLGGTAADMGLAVALAAIAELPGMIFFSRLSRKFGCRNLLMWCSVFFVVKSVGHLLCRSVGMFYLVQAVQFTTYSLFAPGIVYYVNETMEPQDQFKGQSIMALTNTVGSVAASLLGGWLLDVAGVRTMLVTECVVAALGAVLVMGALYGEKKS